MSSIFTQIIARKIPANIVAETPTCLAFLDIRPLAWGHTLVIPKQEVDYLFDLENETLSRLMIFAKQVALGLSKVVPCLRVGIAVVGLEVPHAHIHLVPLHSAYDIDFKKKPLLYSQEDLNQLTQRVSAAIQMI